MQVYPSSRVSEEKGAKVTQDGQDAAPSSLVAILPFKVQSDWLSERINCRQVVQESIHLS